MGIPKYQLVFVKNPMAGSMRVMVEVGD